MATHLTKQLIDDIDGSAALNTVRFAWAGHNYEIDLNKKNAAAFEKAIKVYVDHARKVRAPAKALARRSTGSAANSPGRLSEIREWGRRNGWEVSDRGRVPNALVEAFDAASG